MDLPKFSIWAMKKILFIILFCCASAFAYPPLCQPRCEEEALFLRRIISLWRDQDYELAKSQIQNYLLTESETPFREHFQAMLGDIFLHQKDYTRALEAYQTILSLELQSDVLIKRFHALYALERYQELYQEGCKLVDSLSIEGKFYFAESAFREALLLTPFDEGKLQAKKLFNEALSVYEGLKDHEQFGKHARLAMAEIYQNIGENEKAASLYLELADEKKDSKVLFHAAIMLLNFDEKKACEIFEMLAKQGHEKAGLQWLKFLAKEKKWDLIKKHRELFLSYTGNDVLSLSYFYLGMAAFEDKYFLQALLDLTKSLEKNLSPPLDRNALLAIISSAKEIGKIEACERSFELIRSRYPEEVASATYMKALCYEKVGHDEKALVDLEKMIAFFPDHPLTEKAYVEKCTLLGKAQEWKKSRETILTFFEKYPESPLKIKMAALAVDFSLKLIAETNTYEELALDIERGLAWKAFHDEKEKRNLLAKAYLKLEKIQSALNLLQEMDRPDPLLLTMIYVKQGALPEKVVMHGEEALLLHPELENLHLHLFNAYIKLFSENHDGELQKKAAEHLDAIVDTYPVSLENRLWLAHYFFDSGNERALSLLESLLQTEANLSRFHEEALLLAKLYQKKKMLEKAFPLVQKIIDLDAHGAQKAELMLADLYHEISDIKHAEELYLKLETSPSLSIAYKAKLENARLSFQKNPEKSLKKLADLKVRKTLVNEPIHLEASLDYAEFKASQAAPHEMAHLLLDYLLEMKEEFTAQENLWSKDYHASRELLPEQDRIYQAYMRYLDARIYQLQSMIASDPYEKKSKAQTAKALFSTLLQGKYAVSDYVIKKAAEKFHDE